LETGIGESGGDGFQGLQGIRWGWVKARREVRLRST
jgi:hypothetical protein